MKTVLHEIVEQGVNLVEITRDKYLRDLDVWIEFAGPDPSGWTRSQCEVFYRGLLERMKPQSAKRLMASIAYASKWWSVRENNPSLDFVALRYAPAADKIEKLALTQEQAEQLLATTGSGSSIDLRDRAIIVLGLETGMRRMSLVSASLDGLSGHLSGERQGYPAMPVRAKGRRDEPLIVPISDTAKTAIEIWRAWLMGYGVRKGSLFRALVKRIVPTGESLFVPGERGVSESLIQKMLAERSSRCGFHVHPHMFRHTFVTWRTAAGYTPIEIAAMTGHQLTELGAMKNYIDRKAIGEKIRNSTPDWLRKLIMGGNA